MDEETARAWTEEKIREFTVRLGEAEVSDDGELYFWNIKSSLEDSSSGKSGSDSDPETEKIHLEADTEAETVKMLS